MILSRINQHRYFFSHIYEMRITFSSSIRDYITSDYYLKQPESLCEIRMNQILAKNPRLIKCLNKQSNRPLIRKYTHRSIIEVVNDIQINIFSFISTSK